MLKTHFRFQKKNRHIVAAANFFLLSLPNPVLLQWQLKIIVPFLNYIFLNIVELVYILKMHEILATAR
jgi:hypothetical protein